MTEPPLDQHKLVYETLSPAEAFYIKELIYFYNKQGVRSVRVNAREGRPRLGDAPELVMQVNVWTDQPLRAVLESALQGIPQLYQDQVLGWFDRHSKRRPTLRK